MNSVSPLSDNVYAKIFEDVIELIKFKLKGIEK